MSYFASSEKLQDILGNFFRLLANDSNIGPKLKASNLIVKFNYTEPALSITINCTKDPVEILFNDTTLKPEVEMTMKADTAHKFWFGKVNLVIALTRREITAKGSIPKVLKLLPVIKPAYALYPKFIQEKDAGLML
ncbi:MAG: SCP2 sterol-binding domain-containing protein [Deltaproteobacteria bacterium]|nr:SCP2 sterol-binding domain-containing protein [Deltaproteobacteria bacterium]